MSKIGDAVWAAKLHLEKGTMLSDRSVREICEALVGAHESALANPPPLMVSRPGLPPVQWRTYAEPGTMSTPEGEVHARALADARLTCPTGMLVQKPLTQGGEVVYVPAPCTCGASPNRLPHQRDENCQLFTDGLKVTP